MIAIASNKNSAPIVFSNVRTLFVRSNRAVNKGDLDRPDGDEKSVNSEPVKMKGCKTSPAAIRRRHKIARALKLRMGGMTFAEIGRTMGFDTAHAFRLVEQGMREIGAEQREEIVRARKLESMRLDALQIPFFQAAVDGDLGALDRVLEIIAQRIELWGLAVRPERGSAKEPAPRQSRGNSHVG
jgi:hypothetical protein